MRITLGTIVLCGGQQDGEHPEGLVIEHPRTVQISPLLRAAAVRVFSRGNSQVRISFSLTREHASFILAQEYLVKHDASIPTTGDLIITCEEPNTAAGGGGEIVRYKLSDGQVEDHRGRHIGVSTIHAYSLVGGSLALVT